MDKKKIVASVVASVSAVAIVLTGSFAWFTTQQTKLNNLATKNPSGSLTIAEDFDEQQGSDLQPGLAVDKKVSVVQTGESTAIARVRLEEFLSKYEADGNEVKLYKDTKDDASGLPTIPSTESYVARTMTDAALLAKLEGEGLVTPGAANVAAALTADVVTTGTGLYAVTAAIPSIGVTIDPSVTIAPASLYCYYDTYTIGLTTYKTYKFVAWNTVAGGFQVVDVTTDPSDAAKVTKLEYEFQHKLGYTGAVNKQSTLAEDASDLDAVLRLTFADSGAAEGSVKPISAWGADKTAGTTANWYYDTDGWAYWGKKIAAGQSTTDFLESIMLASTATNAYAGIDWKVNVRMQGVQADATAMAATWDDGSSMDITDLSSTLQAALTVATDKEQHMTAAATTMMNDVIAA